MQVITAARTEWIAPFTGLEPRQFRKLVSTVAKRGGEEIADGRPGRQWRLRLEDRVLLVAVYWRTNLTMRQIGPLFGVSHSAAHRVIDTLGPLLTLAPVRKRRVDQVAIVDGTLVPTRDHRLAAPSKNYRYSTNLQVAIDADTRLVIATGDPQPGNRNDCTAYRDSGIDQTLAGRPVMADGGYQGNPEVIMPFRKRRAASTLADTASGIAHLRNLALAG
jgi:Helix-turn-helix of DDE superfamily endonuclease/Transposase DDE domain